jgi:hypothetical protein
VSSVGCFLVPVSTAELVAWCLQPAVFLSLFLLKDWLLSVFNRLFSGLCFYCRVGRLVFSAGCLLVSVSTARLLLGVFNRLCFLVSVSTAGLVA